MGGTQPLFDMSKAQPIQGAPMFDMTKAQPIAQPQEQPGWLDKDIPLDSYTDATLSGVQSIGRGIRSGGQSLWDMVKPMTDEERADKTNLYVPGAVTARRMLKPLAQTGSSVTQIPAAIHDINQSPDPVFNYAKAAQETAGQGAGQALTALATEGIARATPKLLDSVQGMEVAPKVKALAKVGAQDAASHVPFAGRLVRRPSLMDYVDAARTTSPKPVYPGASEPTMPPAVAQAAPLGTLPQTGALPASQTGEALGTLGTKSYSPQPIAETPPGQNIGDLLNESLGGKPVRPGVALKDQMKAPAAAPAEGLPDGFKATPQSSMIEGYSYNPETQEFDAVLKQTGERYRHGQVSPDQVQAFESAKSKGSAYNKLIKNGPGSVGMGKVDANGNLIPRIKPRSMQSASPDDPLVEQVKKSPPGAYRSRNVGEKGIPYRPESHAQATATQADAERLAPSRGDTEGQPQQIVGIDLSKTPGFSVKPGPSGADWFKFHGEVPESAVEPTFSEKLSSVGPEEDLTDSWGEALKDINARKGKK